MNGTLFRRGMQTSWKITALLAAVLSLYISMIVSMFDPKLGESLAAMAESMPQLFAAFGMDQPGATLTEFMANYLYGFLLVVFPLVLALLLVWRLIARPSDRGDLVWMLSGAQGRLRVLLSQLGALVCCQLLLAVYCAALGAGCAGAMFPGELDLPAFLRMNAGLFGLQLFLAAACVLLACLFGEMRRGFGVGAGLCALFLLLKMLSDAGEKTELLRWFTPLSLFDPDGLLAASGSAAMGAAVLYLGAAGMLAAACVRFCRRDLAL